MELWPTLTRQEGKTERRPSQGWENSSMRKSTAGRRQGQERAGPHSSDQTGKHLGSEVWQNDYMRTNQQRKEEPS